MKLGLAGERKAELGVGSLESGETREISGSVEASYLNIPQTTSMAWIICFEGPGLSAWHGLFVLEERGLALGGSLGALKDPLGALRESLGDLYGPSILPSAPSWPPSL